MKTNLSLLRNRFTHSFIFIGLFLIFSAPAAFARVGESLSALTSRYGEPVGTQEIGGLKGYSFEVNDFLIVSYFEGADDSASFEVIVIGDETPPEAVVNRVAEDNRVVRLDFERVFSMQESGVVPPSLESIWIIASEPQVFVAFEPSPDSGGAIIFASDIQEFKRFFNALTSQQTEGL